MNVPIFVMAFSRPEYLRQVLASLRDQTDAPISERPIYLFQDGAVNRFSGKRHATDEAIAECVDIFKSYFPEGVVYESQDNVGVALNFDRAERFAFETLGVDVAIFLEDDLVLGEHYIATLELLIRKFSDDRRVGYLAAYGDHRNDISTQTNNSKKFLAMGHNWGFALFRRQWLRIRPRITQYLNLISETDYRDRDFEKISHLFSSWGFGCPGTSQDTAKNIACCAEGVIKLNTFACFASYIGARGLHMNEKIFTERGYSQTVVYQKRVLEFEDLSDDLYQTTLAEQTRSNSKETSKVNSIGTPPLTREPLHAHPDQTLQAVKQLLDTNNSEILKSLSKELIIIFYFALLFRAPDPSGLASYSRLISDKPPAEALFLIIRSIIKSEEFYSKYQLNVRKVEPPKIPSP